MLGDERAVAAFEGAELTEGAAVQLAPGDVLVDLRGTLAVRAVGRAQIGRVDRAAVRVARTVAGVVAAREGAPVIVAAVPAPVLPAALSPTVVTTAVVTTVVTVTPVALTLGTVTEGLAVAEGATLAITLRTAAIRATFTITLRTVTEGAALTERTTVIATVIAASAVALTLGTVTVRTTLAITLGTVTIRAAVAAVLPAALTITLGAIAEGLTVTVRAPLAIPLRTVTEGAALAERTTVIATVIATRAIAVALRTVTIRTTLTITLRAITERLAVAIRTALTVTLRTVTIRAPLAAVLPAALTIALRTVTIRTALAVTLRTITVGLAIAEATATLAIPRIAVAERLAVALGAEIPAASPAAVVLCHGGFLLVRADQRRTQSISSPLWFFPGTPPGTIPSILGDGRAVSRATPRTPDAGHTTAGARSVACPGSLSGALRGNRPVSRDDVSEPPDRAPRP